MMCHQIEKATAIHVRRRSRYLWAVSLVMLDLDLSSVTQKVRHVQ